MKGKVVLITGGTGTFGKAFLNKVLSQNPKEVRIFSRDEKKQYAMEQKYKGTPVTFVIGDIRDYSSIEDATKGVDYIFHAAAMKQVPSCENFPPEAIKTNVEGSSNLLKAAIANHVDKVVMLSTDKACSPTSTMGATKMLMEKLAFQAAEKDPITDIIVTRFGNIISSRGSVIPLFLDQAHDFGEILVTDPEMTRFFMSVEDAVDLVDYALKEGFQGDLFIKKSKASSLASLASCVQKLHPQPVEVRTIGPRAGEKKHETLITEEEARFAIDSGDFMKIPFPRQNPTSDTRMYHAYHSACAEQYTEDELAYLVKKYGGER